MVNVLTYQCLRELRPRTTHQFSYQNSKCPFPSTDSLVPAYHIPQQNTNCSLKKNETIINRLYFINKSCYRDGRNGKPLPVSSFFSFMVNILFSTGLTYLRSIYPPTSWCLCECVPAALGMHMRRCGPFDSESECLAALSFRFEVPSIDT